MFERFLRRFRKAPNSEAIAALQDKIANAVVESITDLHDGQWEGQDWVRIGVNHEMSIEEGRRSSTQAVVLARKPGEPLESLSFRLGAGTKQKLIELRTAMCVSSIPWTTVDITIDRSGRYDFAFGYDRPRRLEGDLLYTPLTGFLEQYKAESGES